MTSISTFMYFAFGSNLLRERLQMMNPSATFHSIGRLKDYNLNFGVRGEKMSNRWHGGVATIEESIGNEVWGVIWKMNRDDLPNLDKQEGVDKGIYRPLEVKVDTHEGEVVCRTYQMNDFRAMLPSPPYKQVICLGAKQNGIPSDYIRKLEAMKTNDYNGPSIFDDIRRAME
ncbi:gamma-glutamylcyclotransferase a [Anguilla anguilla]|uniref:Gamma-glutamylcyclotransferase n=2 Tax=Anguilla anguilla TaxID=7936 RepID=A0A9D3RTI2_ANGAN|nr:gamma-glutamylcyclotransferase a [Anguilla anguilla]KAG5842385.1 hypothetical protein ANANG_G00177100 [Anguilla anguilla]